MLLWAGGFNMIMIGGWRLLFKLLNRVGLAPFRGTLGLTLLGRKSIVIGDFSYGREILEKLKTGVGSGYQLEGLVS